mmetsp:Transcript_3642/g.6019  ORF Transcript_3642/g.6019 Transcript_3642/m.6019 type:complete len:384 (+) Transcript_3642:78-1229(+)
MQLIVTKFGTESLAVIDLPDDADMEMLAQMIQAELGVPFQHQLLECEGVVLRPGTSLSSQGIADGCSIVVKEGNPMAVSSDSSSGSTGNGDSAGIGPIPQLLDPGTVPPERIIELITQHPEMVARYKALDSELGEMLESGDIGKLRTFVMKRLMSRHKVVYEARQEEIALQTADPMDPEVQKKIAERIRQQNVEENLQSAMDNLPESFGRVTMLYVPLELNRHPIKAFVDSGAQITIMSKRCAEACGVMHLVDTRMKTQLRGVGTSQSLGRIHAVQVKFGQSYMAVSVTVVPSNDMDFLFGLDNLRRLRGVIDLDRNMLCLDGASGKEEVTFLGESELPENAKGTYEGNPDDKDNTGGEGDSTTANEGNSKLSGDGGGGGSST